MQRQPSLVSPGSFQGINNMTLKHLIRQMAKSIVKLRRVYSVACIGSMAEYRLSIQLASANLCTSLESKEERWDTLIDE